MGEYDNYRNRLEDQEFQSFTQNLEFLKTISDFEDDTILECDDYRDSDEEKDEDDGACPVNVAYKK